MRRVHNRYERLTWPLGESSVQQESENSLRASFFVCISEPHVATKCVVKCIFCLTCRRSCAGRGTRTPKVLPPADPRSAVFANFTSPASGVEPVGFEPTSGGLLSPPMRTCRPHLCPNKKGNNVRRGARRIADLPLAVWFP